MVQTELPFNAARKRQRKPTLTEQMRDLLLAHPNEPLDIDALTPVGGKSAYRTELSRCRKRYGMDIRQESPQLHWPDGKARPRTIYRPAGSEEGRAA